MVEEAQGWLHRRAARREGGLRQAGQRPPRLRRTIATSSTCRRSARASVADKQLIIDLGIAIKWDVATAVKRVQAFDDFDITWIEEPLGAWDPEGYATLRAKTRTLIGYGEREWNVDGFERVLATGTCDVIGCDPGRAEGITGLQADHRARRGVPPTGQRPRLVVGDRHRGEPGDLLLVSGLQGVRGQTAAQSDAARPGHGAVRH